MRLQKRNLFALGKVLLASYAVTALLLFILAAVVQRTGLEEGGMRLGITAVYIISCLAGGFLAGKITGEHKFVWGLLLGFSYFVILGCISLAVKREVSGGSFLLNLILCIGGGMLGGMIS